MTTEQMLILAQLGKLYAPSMTTAILPGTGLDAVAAYRAALRMNLDLSLEISVEGKDPTNDEIGERLERYYGEEVVRVAHLRMNTAVNAAKGGMKL